MAQKQKQQRPFPIDDPPTASSSEYEEDEDQQPSSQQRKEEEVSSEEEEEEVSSQEDHDDQPSSLPPASTNPRPKPSSSSSDTDTDSEPEPTKVKPKPVDPAQKPKPQPSPAPPRSGSKRVAENNVQPKRAKKKPTDASSSAAAAVASDEETEEDGKKSGGHTKLFQRLWSEEDELAILKGMAEFTSKTGQDPYKYADSFHDFVKKSLHVEASSNQLKEKIRRLKKKFETNAGRGKNGEGPRLYKPHDQTVFELSKKVWGGANGPVEKTKPTGKAAKTPKKEATSRNVAKPESKPQLEPVEFKESEKHDSGDVNSLYRKISGFKELDEEEMKRGLALIGESKRKELEGKWKKLRHAEMELVANRSLLIGEQIKLIFEALQSSDNQDSLC